MTEGMVGLVQVPTEYAEAVVNFLSARYPGRTLNKRGFKPTVFASNAIGEISCKGLPAPERELAKVLVEGILLGLSGKGFSVENPSEAEEEEV